MSLDDETLMLQVREGQLSGLGPLFERHHEAIYRFCYRMTGNGTLSEDLCQEVFTRILRYRESFRADSEFRPWLYQLARNVCNDHYRRGRSRPQESESIDELQFAVDRPGASREVEGREACTLLHQSLLKLPPEQRELLLLSRFEFRRHKEIAELMGCSVGAVKVRVHRALRRLHEHYSALSGEGQA